MCVSRCECLCDLKKKKKALCVCVQDGVKERVEARCGCGSLALVQGAVTV